MTEPVPVASNPFSLIAFVLFKVRYSLEEYDGQRPPRWVRISRGRQFQGEVISDVVSGAVLGLSESTTYMADLTVRIEELLIQTDAAKAIAEVTLDFIEAASSPEFAAAVGVLVGPDFSPQVTNALDDINTAAQNIEGYLDYIPEPEDVRQLGHELYQLLCIVQRDFPRQTDGSIDPAAPELTGTDHVDLEATGKIRLCAWAYGRRVRARGLGPTRLTVDVDAFGTRRLFSGGTLPTDSDGRWEGPEDTITIFDRDFDGPNDVDLEELVELLGAHGYVDPAVPSSPTSITAELERLLLQFQFINELPLSGEVDDHTINRLMNYDFARKNLRRAKPFDADADWPWGTDPVSPPDPVVSGRELPLVNPGADDFEDEGITPVPRTPYSYYEVRTAGAIGDPGNLPLGRGWVADSGGLLAFVALRSRNRNVGGEAEGRYDGGIWSEGEAADGRYFWSARHVEPWKGGRTGAPEEGALFGSFGAVGPSAGLQSRMFQWVPVPASVFTSPFPSVPPGSTARLYVVASVLQRSLYRDRGSAGLPDQGRIRIEAYTNGFYDPVTGNALSPRDLAQAAASEQTAWFPDHGTTAVALSLDEVDRKRVWFLRKTEPMDLTGIANISALCLVAEGLHQSAFDTDAYFDDFRVEYYWRIVPDAS
ncbi:MAG: hypothetical protein AB1Z98_32080 [Nannocystaceae bacterium]